MALKNLGSRIGEIGSTNHLSFAIGLLIDEDIARRSNQISQRRESKRDAPLFWAYFRHMVMVPTSICIANA